MSNFAVVFDLINSIDSEVHVNSILDSLLSDLIINNVMLATIHLFQISICMYMYNVIKRTDIGNIQNSTPIQYHISGTHVYIDKSIRQKKKIERKHIQPSLIHVCHATITITK